MCLFSFLFLDHRQARQRFQKTCASTNSLMKREAVEVKHTVTLIPTRLSVWRARLILIRQTCACDLAGLGRSSPRDGRSLLVGVSPPWSSCRGARWMSLAVFHPVD